MKWKEPLPPVFVQVLILKGVEVSCFDPDSQVLLVKELVGLASAEGSQPEQCGHAPGREVGFAETEGSAEGAGDIEFAQKLIARNYPIVKSIRKNKKTKEIGLAGG